MQRRRGCQQNCSSRSRLIGATTSGGLGSPTRLATRVACAAKCHYKVLGVSTTASADEIKSAFRKLALQLHPDVNAAPDATNKFKSVKDAYEVLSDPKQRQEYNQQRTRKARTRTHNSSAYTSTTNRSTTQPHYRRSHADHVVYEYVMDDEELDDDPANCSGFMGWYSSSGSWQSSWQANRKKQQARAQQQAEEARQQQYASAAEALLQQLDDQTLQVVTQVFGTQLEHLDNLEELMNLLSALELLRAQGIQPDPNMFGDSHARHNSRRAAGSRFSSSNRNTASKSSHTSTGSSSRSAYSGQTSTSCNTTSSSSGSSTKRSSSSNWNSSSQSRPEQAKAGSTKQRCRQASGRQQHGSSNGRTGRMPPFDEMSWEQLFATMEDRSNPRAAAAARAWASEYATMGANPYLAADLQALLMLDWLAEDWEASLYDGFGRDTGSSRTGAWARRSSRQDTEPIDARRKYRSKVGPAKDYVRYSSDEDTDSEGPDVSGRMGLDELVEQADGWYSYDDDSADYE